MTGGEFLFVLGCLTWLVGVVSLASSEAASGSSTGALGGVAILGLVIAVFWPFGLIFILSRGQTLSEAARLFVFVVSGVFLWLGFLAQLAGALRAVG